MDNHFITFPPSMANLARQTPSLERTVHGVVIHYPTSRRGRGQLLKKLCCSSAPPFGPERKFPLEDRYPPRAPVTSSTRFQNDPFIPFLLEYEYSRHIPICKHDLLGQVLHLNNQITNLIYFLQSSFINNTCYALYR